MSQLARRPEELWQEGVGALEEQLGGRARARTVALLAGVLALDSADKGAVGALAVELERTLHIGNTEVGLLVTVATLVGALFTLPVGVLTDRFNRSRLLWVSILAWGVAEAASGVATSFLVLLLIRLALGMVTATAGPTVASLVGDLFPAGERGRMYGFILMGELVGAGLGILLAGEVAGWFGWRAAFAVLALPSFGLAYVVRRHLPEPARGGQSRLEPGADHIPSAREVEAHPEEFEPAVVDDDPREDRSVLEAVEGAGYRPSTGAVLRRDPGEISTWEAVRYVLRVRTNLVLIFSNSLGYFFLGGLETFALVFLRGRYGLGQGAASALLVVVGAGAVAGVLTGGRLADRLLRRGVISARLVVGAAAFVAAAVLFAPGLASPWLFFSLPVFIVAGAALAAPNAPLSAARLDVIPAPMWGRAEGVRTVVQTLLQAFAPLLFGLVSQWLGGRHTSGFGTGVGDAHAAVSTAAAHGVELTFLLMLVPLAASGAMLYMGRRRYPRDVAAAGESERRLVT